MMRATLWIAILCVALSGCETTPTVPDPSLSTEVKKPAEPQWPDEPFRATRPEAGPQPELKIPPVVVFKLKNGVQVYLIERHQLPVVSMTLLMNAGSYSDPKGKKGLASLSMGLMGEGTKGLEKVAFEARQADLASSLFTFSSLEEVGVGLRTLKRNLGPTFDLAMEMLTQPGMRAADLKRLKESRQAGLKQSRATPKGVGRRLYTSLLYGESHPRGQLLTEESLDAIKMAECKRFIAKLGPKGARLFIVGDITEAEVREIIEPKMKGWRGGSTKAAKLAKAVPRQGTIFLVDLPGAAQSQIYIGHLGPERKAEDYEATSMMARILGGSFSSRINMNLREKQGIAYGARAGFRYNRQGGYFAASSSVRTDATGLALRELSKEIQGMREAPPTAEELLREKQGAALSLPALFTSARRLTATARNLIYFDLPLDYHRGYLERLETVDAARIQAAAKTHLREKGFTVLVVGDSEKIKAELEEIAGEGLFGKGDLVVLDADGQPVSDGAP